MGKRQGRTEDRGAHAGCVNVEAPCLAVPIPAAEDRTGFDPGICYQCLSRLRAGRAISMALLPYFDRPSKLVLLRCHNIHIPANFVACSILRTQLQC